MEEKYEVEAKIGMGSESPKLEAGGKYNVTMGTNKEVNSYIIVPPGRESRINLKSSDKVPAKSRLIIVINGRAQYIELHEGFQAFNVNEENKF